MGTLAIVFFIWILLAILEAFLRLFRSKSAKILNIHRTLRRKLYYNSLISLFIESYSLLSVCCLINFYFLSFESVGVTVHSVACIIFLISIFLLPLLLTRYLRKHFKRLKDPKMIARYGDVYLELNLSGSKMVLLQPVFFIFRRLMLAIAIVVFNKVLIWQIFLMASQIVASTIIIGNVAPFKLHSKNKTELFNEVILMFVMYTIICFSPFVPDLEVKHGIGYLCMAIISVHLLVNLVNMGRFSYSKIKRECIIQKRRKEYKK